MKRRDKVRFGKFSLVLLLLVACSGQERQQRQPEKIMAEEPTNTPNSSEKISIPELEKFIFKPDRFTNNIVPRKLEPAKVAQFLIERIDEKVTLKQFLQVEKVAAFYDTFEAAEKFRQFLNKSESGDEGVRRSIVIARIIGRVGKPEDIEFARQYYHYLVPKVDTIADFEEMISLHDVLRLGKSSTALRERLTAKINSLEGVKASDDQARLQQKKLQESIEQKLTRAEKAEPVKVEILNITDRRKRIEEEIKAYLTIDYGFIEYLQPWAVARLKRETWALQPVEQIVRNEMPFKTDVAKSFNGFLGKLNDFELEDEDKQATRLRILRAVKFFEGTLSPEEEDFLKQSKGEQTDILANEGFMLP